MWPNPFYSRALATVCVIALVLTFSPSVHASFNGVFRFPTLKDFAPLCAIFGFLVGAMMALSHWVQLRLVGTWRGRLINLGLLLLLLFLLSVVGFPSSYEELIMFVYALVGLTPKILIFVVAIVGLTPKILISVLPSARWRIAFLLALTVLGFLLTLGILIFNVMTHPNPYPRSGDQLSWMVFDLACLLILLPGIWAFAVVRMESQRSFSRMLRRLSPVMKTRISFFRTYLSTMLRRVQLTTITLWPVVSARISFVQTYLSAVLRPVQLAVITKLRSQVTPILGWFLLPLFALYGGGIVVMLMGFDGLAVALLALANTFAPGNESPTEMGPERIGFWLSYGLVPSIIFASLTMSAHLMLRPPTKATPNGE